MSPVRLKKAADRADPVDLWHDGTGMQAPTLSSSIGDVNTLCEIRTVHSILLHDDD